nr:MAG TPA: hypothetical protein [Caudoviricetes sp.]
MKKKQRNMVVTLHYFRVYFVILLLGKWRK